MCHKQLIIPCPHYPLSQVERLSQAPIHLIHKCVERSDPGGSVSKTHEDLVTSFKLNGRRTWYFYSLQLISFKNCEQQVPHMGLLPKFLGKLEQVPHTCGTDTGKPCKPESIPSWIVNPSETQQMNYVFHAVFTRKAATESLPSQHLTGSGGTVGGPGFKILLSKQQLHKE